MELKLLCYLVPIYALYLVAKSEGTVRVNVNAKKGEATLFPSLLIYPTFFFFWLIKTETLIDWTPVIVPVLCLAFLPLRYVAVPSFRREGTGAGLGVAAATLLLAVTLSLDLNSFFDRGTPTWHEAEVRAKRIETYKNVKSYHLSITPPSAVPGLGEVNVDSTTYDAAIIGKGLSVSICPGALGIARVCGHLPMVTSARTTAAARPVPIAPNRLKGQAGSPPGEIEVPIHMPESYDYKKQAELFDLRRARVTEHAEFVVPGYQPWPNLFGQIYDGVPWWGLHGIYFYGNGPRSHEGPSKESRHFGNPFLLVGVEEPSAWRTVLSPQSEDYFPTPIRMVLNLAQSRGEVTYSIAGYVKHVEAIGRPLVEQRSLTLHNYNARDFGYGYLAPVKGSTKGVHFGSFDQVLELRQFIHRGGSCGIEGGCNNASPYQAELNFFVQELPAHTEIKLWHLLPKDAQAPADFTWDIRIE